MEQSDMWGCDQKGVQQRSTLNLVMHIRDSRNARYLNGSLPTQKLLMWRKMTGMSDDLSTTISLTLDDPHSTLTLTTQIVEMLDPVTPGPDLTTLPPRLKSILQTS